MKYRELYIDLAETLTSLKCYVSDIDFWGYCFQTKSVRAFIVVKPDMSYKEKFFCLSHETGHLFSMKKGKFVWARNPRTEEEANKFAMQLINSKDIDPIEYRKFYERAKRKSKNRKKSWFEI